MHDGVEVDTIIRPLIGLGYLDLRRVTFSWRLQTSPPSLRLWNVYAHDAYRF